MLFNGVSLQPGSEDSHTERRTLHVAGIDVEINGPSAALRILDRMLSRVPTSWMRRDRPIRIDVATSGAGWRIRGDSGESNKVLSQLAPLPDVAGAIVSSMIADVACRTDAVPLRAVLVEREGRALALLGNDWESSLAVAAHLNARGWPFVSSCYSFVSPETLQVEPLRKLLFLTSAGITNFPLCYRRAIEASPWYTKSDGIAFYAVDPSGEGAWSGSARLHAACVLGSAAKSLAATTDSETGAARGAVAWLTKGKGIRISHLELGTPIATSNAIDQWFSGLV